MLDSRNALSVADRPLFACTAADTNGDRTDIERAANERMRELGRCSGEARRRKAKAKQTNELKLTDREQAMAALRRALDGGNMAAMVAAARALLEFDHSPRERLVTVEDAREQLEARVNAIEDHRRRNGEVCSACGGRGIVARASRGGGGPRIVEGGVDLSSSDDQRTLLRPSTREPDG